MTKTSPVVSYAIGETFAIKQDSIPSMPNLQPFSKVGDLRTDSATNRPYATYEPDFWLLSGEYKFFPQFVGNIHVGVVTLAMSDASGDFASAPILTIDFATPHSLDGLNLRFNQYSNDFADNIDVEYFSWDGSHFAQICFDNYTPTTWEFATGKAVANFQRILIYFHSTNNPYRYLRLTGIDYGDVLTFTEADIKTANVVEESDPLSTEVRINTLNLRLYSADADFSIINPAGNYANLAQRQPIAISETVGFQSIFIGQYYVDKWTNPSNTEIEFDCIDLLGVLDTMTYKGGIWLGAGIAVETLLADILNPVYAPFDLDASLYGTIVSGWIPICTYREALQQIALAIGAYVDSSRDRPIKIYPTKITAGRSGYDIALTAAEKGLESPLSMRSLVTGVEVTAHDIISGTGTKQLYNGALTVGTYEITFRQPMHDLSITGGTIDSSDANYASISTTGGTVVLSGQVYVDTQTTFSEYMTGLSTGTMPNIIKIKDATLVNSANAALITARVYDYYQQRLTQNTKLYASQIHIGDVALVDTLYSKQIVGVNEKQSVDLAGGFISEVEIVGAEYA